MSQTVPLSEFRRCLTQQRYRQNGSYVGPGVHIPPRKEDCSCACSEVDEMGRPKYIGFCGADCERRPR